MLQVGGSIQSFLPTVDGHIVAICVTPNLNPRAPQVILCGNGPIMQSAGLALSRQSGRVPVFVKRAVNRWEYRGAFAVKAAHFSGPQFSGLVAGSGREPSDVSLAIELA